MKFILILWLCKLISALIRLIDKHRGSCFSGSVAVSLMPDFIAHFRQIDYDRTIFITGTNGKSTTANLIDHTLRATGHATACNTEGANLLSGVATTLIKNSTLSGRFNKEYLVLEVDERTLPALSRLLPARHLGVTNLQKDQIQRNGDPDFVFRKIAGSIDPQVHLYLNNEEPRSRALDEFSRHAVYFGIAENDRTYRRYNSYSVTLPCPKCGHPIVFSRYNLCNIGSFTCSNCGHRSAGRPHVLLDHLDYEAKTFRCGDTSFTVDYMTPFYLYNYAMVIAICRELGIREQEISGVFRGFVNPAAHDYVFDYKGKELRCLSCKQENPEVMQSLLDIISEDPNPKALFIGMYEIEDFQPFFAGSFYCYDCDFESLAESRITRFVSFSRTACYDVASRLVYAGVPEERITILDTNDFSKTAELIEQCPEKQIYLLTESDHYKKDVSPYLLAHGGKMHE